MFPLRVLGGPVTKADRIVVDVSPSQSFREILMLIQRALPQNVHPPVNADYYDLMEISVNEEGKKAKPTAVYNLSASPLSVKMVTPIVYLRRRDLPSAIISGAAGSGLAGMISSSGEFSSLSPSGSILIKGGMGRSQSISFAEEVVDGSTAQGPRRMASFAFAEPVGRGALVQAMQQQAEEPSSCSADKYMVRRGGPEQIADEGLVSGTDNSSANLGCSPLFNGQRRSTTTRSRFGFEQAAEAAGDPSLILKPMVTSSSSVVVPSGLEQLLAMYGVTSPAVEHPARVVLMNQLLRKASRMDRVEDFFAAVETFSRNSANVAAVVLPSESILTMESVASQSLSPAGSPMNILRRARSISAMEGVARQQQQHMQFRMQCNNVLWRMLDSYLPAERIAQADVVSWFLDEIREQPKSHIAALTFRFLVQKHERLDFEREVQFEQFDIQLIEFVKREQLRRLLIVRTFFVGWCTWQRFFLINHEQMERFRIWDEEEAVAFSFEHRGFILLELNRRTVIGQIEQRQRLFIKLFNLQVLEQFARDSVFVECNRQYGLIDFERELAHADRVRQRIARSCWIGYISIIIAQTSDQQHIHRSLLVKKEFRTRLLLLELYEQLQRRFMEDKILEWVTPIMKKIAAKAVEDGKILLAVELKERQYAYARMEARQRSMSKDRRMSGAL
jgi:hypothetical protein